MVIGSYQVHPVLDSDVMPFSDWRFMNWLQNWHRHRSHLHSPLLLYQLIYLSGVFGLHSSWTNLYYFRCSY